jgi:SpoIID/LytB domain protein
VAHGLDGKAAREDRRYRGRLLVTVDAGGALAVVNALPLEALLRGLVPSEMPAGSPLEALKAQAVTARSNVLAQIGTRHLGDPYVLCAEVHCQAYRGTGAETARTDEAVRATAGEALFGRANRTLVDGVYSAMCGGHGEDASAVWGGTPDPSLRGLPDLPAEFAGLWSGGLREDGRLRVFLADPPDAYCRRPAAARKDRFRWERRFTPGDLDALTGALGVGPVRALTVLERGVSGRAVALRVEGARGAADVRGELAIRRLLRNLPSSMFVVDREGEELVLRGGGWGHGAGMCQWGAIGRAEAGQGYREILGASFAGAEVAKIY